MICRLISDSSTSCITAKNLFLDLSKFSYGLWKTLR